MGLGQKSRFLLQSFTKTFVPPLVLTLLIHTLLPSKVSRPSALLLTYLAAVPLLDALLSWPASRARKREMKQLGARPIPTVKGRLPGNVDILWKLVMNERSEYAGETIRQWSEEYGPTFNMRILWANQIVSVDPSNIKYVLSTSFNSFEKSAKFADMMAAFGRGIFTTDRSEWKSHRLTVQPFFTKDKMRQVISTAFDRHADKVLAIILHAAQADSSNDDRVTGKETDARVTSRDGKNPGTRSSTTIPEEDIVQPTPVPQGHVSGGADSHVGAVDVSSGRALDVQELFSRFTLDAGSDFLWGGGGVGALSAFGSPEKDDEYDTFIDAFNRVNEIASTRIRIGSTWPLFEMFSGDKTREPMKAINKFIDPIVNEAMVRHKFFQRQDVRKTAAGSPKKSVGKASEVERGASTEEDAESHGEDGQGTKSGRSTAKGETLLDHLVLTSGNPQEIKDSLLNMLLAARDTTSSLLTFTTYVLSVYPDVMRRLREEIMDVMGSRTPTEALSHSTKEAGIPLSPTTPTQARFRASSPGVDDLKTPSPTLEDLGQMVYLRAVLNEVLRLFPPVPFNIRRSIGSSVLPSLLSPQGPFYMPARTSFTFSPLLLQRRYDMWGEDAAEFRPERWLERAKQRAASSSSSRSSGSSRLSSESSGSQARSIGSDSEGESEQKRSTGWSDSYSFIPFNAGPRVCLGRQFAYTEVSVLLVKLLMHIESFELALPPGSKPRTEEWTKQHEQYLQKRQQQQPQTAASKAPSTPATVKASSATRHGVEQCWPRSTLTLYSQGGLYVRARLASRNQ